MNPNYGQQKQGQYGQQTQYGQQAPHGPYGQKQPQGQYGQKIPQRQPQNAKEVLNPKRHIPNFSVKADFVELARGKGIDIKEYDTIIEAAKRAYRESRNDSQTISYKTGKEIKNILKGQWFVFVSQTKKKYDFTLSTIASSDFLAFSIGETLFQVCRLRE